MSPAYLRLYKHVLESIFTHLNLSELARVSATCRDWSGAVYSMRPIGACAGKGKHLQSMRNSRLVRHVSYICIIETPIGVSGLTSLCDIIKQSNSLLGLTLCATSIGDAGAVAIAEAIAQSKSLLWVNLWRDTIGDQGAIAIAEAIKQSTLLTKVDLYRNYIGDKGACSIAKAIKQSKAKVVVVLHGNYTTSDKGVVAIEEAIKQRENK